MCQWGRANGDGPFWQSLLMIYLMTNKLKGKDNFRKKW